MAFSQSVRKGQVSINCKLCETDRPIQWKCMDCSILMCGHCKDKVHSQFKNAQDHKIISIKEVGLHTEKLDFTNMKCHAHTGQSSCLYCYKCEILVCPTCIAKVHKKHDLIEISDAYNLNVEILKKGQSKMQKSNSNINVKKDQLDKVGSEEISKYSKAREDILKHETTVKEQVEQYFQELIIKLEQNHDAVLTSVKSDLHAISLIETQTEDKIKEVQDLIHISNAPEFFKEFKKVKKNMETQEPRIKTTYNSSTKFVLGNITQSNIGSLQDDESFSAESDISLVINNEYRTELEKITYVCPCIDQSIWLHSGKYGVLQRVKPEGTNLKLMSTYNFIVYGMAVTPSNQLLLCVKGTSRIQQISCTGKLTDSVFDVNPYLPTTIHVISENKLLVGAYEGKPGRNAVIIMDKKGDKETVYEHYKHNQPLFSYPLCITSTSNGNIQVVDKIPDYFTGKVVILGQDGHIKNEYAGHSTINKGTPFKPVDIVTTPSDNVIVIDLDTQILHILNNNGQFVTYFNIDEIGIRTPRSLAFNTAGQLYIGCPRAADSKTKEAKLYKINITGFYNIAKLFLEQKHMK
ncbi:uncharacterized protein LOC127698651 [Mytilus californianus]|uniref:uncharacterized protein LOC127698651 n=1 Tax=Mytilus californianus TaxID=6549 RepID=UPI00224635DA|nr:uncharacterized protein LOC127698651 [Mytilus californianus]